MTDEEWLTATEPTPMLEFLRGKASDRKLRLFACACCRRMWKLPLDIRSRRAIEVAERFADGLADDNERVAVEEDAMTADRMTTHLAAPASRVLHEDATEAVVHTSELSAAFAVDADEPSPVELAAQSGLFRDIFGNPFRPVVAHPAWLTDTVQSIASAIYQDRAFDRLPILADALEEAGCTNADVLLHCRQPGEHVRGCWVVDLVLGKE